MELPLAWYGAFSDVFRWRRSSYRATGYSHSLLDNRELLVNAEQSTKNRQLGMPYLEHFVYAGVVPVDSPPILALHLLHTHSSRRQEPSRVRYLHLQALSHLVSATF